MYFFRFFICDSARWAAVGCRQSLLLFFIVIYFPWIVIVLLSFSESNAKNIISSSLSKVWNTWTMQNYRVFFSFSASLNDFFWEGLLNSLLLSAASLLPSLWIAVVSSFALWKKESKSKGWILKLSNLSISAPDLIQGLSFLFLMSAVLFPMGLNLGFVSLLFSHIAILVPYAIILIYPKMEKLNRKLILASYDLNCGEFETLFKIIVPQLKETIIFTSIVLIILSMDDFIISNLVKGRVVLLSTQLYTMKKGIKAWSLTFGALLLLISAIFFLGYSIFTKFRAKKIGEGDTRRLWNLE